MSAIVPRLARARRTLATAVAVRELVVAAVAGAVFLLAGVATDALVGLPLGARRSLAPVASLVALGVVVLHGARRLRDVVRASDEAVALWFERRLPTLRYSLVTLMDPRTRDAARSLETVVSDAPLEAETTMATRAALRDPALALVAALLVLAMIPGGAVARVTAPREGDALERLGASGRAVTDPLATIVVRISPPAYAELSERVVDDPSSVAALAGGRVRIEGKGGSVRAVVGVDTLGSRSSESGWRIELPVPARATGVRLLGLSRSRVLLLEPVADSAPSARLDQPTRDSVLRVARGTVSVAAELRDDLGLAEGVFEYILSAGAGETFTFRSGQLAATRFDRGVRTARLEGVLLLDSLLLGPGDLVHIRAVARDHNDVSGPGVGASETRTLRIARADEYDSVSVDPLPPTEPEKSALSQRMILLMTEELVARRRRIAVPELQRESRRIAAEQTKLRKRVGEVVFVRLGEDGGEHAHFAGDGHEHGTEGPVDAEQILAAAERAANVDPTRVLQSEGDETPIVAINRPLLEAYNHMWRATTELEIASPASAVPWMERAIEALQRARAAERIYLRGRAPRVVVDLVKVRGTGKDSAAPGTRTARTVAEAERAARIARFDALLERVVADPLAAADSLLLLRLTLPEDERATASALDAAAAALHRGGDVTALLQRARRALAGSPVRRDGLRAWGR